MRIIFGIKRSSWDIVVNLCCSLNQHNQAALSGVFHISPCRYFFPPDRIRSGFATNWNASDFLAGGSYLHTDFMVRCDLLGDRYLHHFFHIVVGSYIWYDIDGHAVREGCRRSANILRFCCNAYLRAENEGGRRRPAAWGWIFHGQMGKLKDGYRVGRARKCIFRRPLP